MEPFCHALSTDSSSDLSGEPQGRRTHNFLSYCGLGSLLESQTSGLCLLFYLLIHASGTDSYNIKVLLVSPALHRALLIWVLKTSSWTTSGFSWQSLGHVMCADARIIAQKTHTHAHKKKKKKQKLGQIYSTTLYACTRQCRQNDDHLLYGLFLLSSPSQLKWSHYHEMEDWLFPLKCPYLLK